MVKSFGNTYCADTVEVTYVRSLTLYDLEQNSRKASQLLSIAAQPAHARLALRKRYAERGPQVDRSASGVVLDGFAYEGF
jgi:hypothetical protein